MKIQVLLLTVLLSLFLGCDSGVGPKEKPITPVTIQSGVTGTLTFNGEWPAKAAEVRMVTSKKFPPEMTDIIYGPLIPADSLTYDYEFALDPGVYKFVGLAWKNEGADWNFPSICSFYFEAGSDSLAPLPVTVGGATPVVTGADIKVNRAKARIVSAAKITGSIAFNGVWPSEFTEARVIATTRFDLATLDLPTTNDLAFSPSIAKGTTALNYEIPAFPGDFKATFIIFFKADGKISTDNIFYANDHGGLDMATTYKVELNQSVKGPDFTITF